MPKSIHLFKLFYDSDMILRMPVPRTIIKGFGFDSLMYMTTENQTIKFAEITHSDIPEVFKIWKKSEDDKVLLKQNQVISTYSPDSHLSNEFVLQEFIKDAKEFIATWAPNSLKFNLLLSDYQERIMQSYMESIKLLIDTELKTISSKLTKLEVSFLINYQGINCLGLHSYSYNAVSLPKLSKPSSLKKLKKKHSPNNPKNMQVHIEKAIEEITKNQESIRNIRYQSWITKVKKGEKLYPNEELFARNIAKQSQFKAKSAAKCLKDLKMLSVQLRVSLSEKKFQAQLNEGIRMKLENALNKRRMTFMITRLSLSPPILQTLDDITVQTARNLITSSERNLTSLSKFHRLTSN